MAAALPQQNAKVLEVLPNARYRVLVEGRDEILAHLSGDMRMKAVRFLPGDAVTVEISPFDQTLGRIVIQARKPNATTTPERTSTE